MRRIIFWIIYICSFILIIYIVNYFLGRDSVGRAVNYMFGITGICLGFYYTFRKKKPKLEKENNKCQ